MEPLNNQFAQMAGLGSLQGREAYAQRRYLEALMRDQAAMLSREPAQAPTEDPVLLLLGDC